MCGSLPRVFTKPGKLQVNTIKPDSINLGREIARGVQQEIILKPHDRGLTPSPLANAIDSLLNLSISSPLIIGPDSS